MTLTEVFTAQLEREAAITRRMLERVPGGHNDWKPHDKSMAFGYLAHLVATMPGWLAMAVLQDSLDINPPGGGPKPEPWSTSADLVSRHDATVANARAALAGTTDAHLMTPWKLLVAGNVVMETPRHQVIEDTFTHLSHHRGQLSVYLRLKDVALASIYGPSADDRRF